jgi:uncharacterized protein with PQ loop repeat
MSLELTGWIGAVAFALCALPQALKSHNQGHSRGIAPLFLTLWIIGELSMLIYTLPTQQWPLIINYAANLVFTGIIAWYKIKPRSTRR